MHKPVWRDCVLWSGQYHCWRTIKAWNKVFRATDCLLQGTGMRLPSLVRVELFSLYVLHLLFRTSSDYVKRWLLWQLEAIIHEAGNDGSITNIDALNVWLENQVRYVSILEARLFICFKGSFQCRSSVFVYQRRTFPFKLAKLNDYFLLV
jgi:hypothetical protein